MLIGWPTSSIPARAVSGARKISVSGGGGADVCAKSASATTDTYRMGGIIWREVECKEGKGRNDHVTLRSRPHAFERRARKARKGFHARIGSTDGCHGVTESLRTNRAARAS